MSAQATEWAWRQAEKVDSQGQLLVLLALAEHATVEGECFPNRRTIAAMCGFASTGSVTRHINRIAELGLAVKGERFDTEKKGRQTSNIYQLALNVEAPSWSATPPVAAEPPPPGSDSATPGTNSTSNQQKGKTDTAASPDVKQVWDHYMQIFKPARAAMLGPSRVRQIEIALKEYPAPDLCLAIDGLYEWRKRKPGDRTLSAIFKTYPGGNPLADQIAFFIEQAKGSTGVGRKFPSADRAIVAEKQRHVQRGHRLTDNAEAVEQAKDAEQWLREHGIETVKAEGELSFRPLEEGSAAA